MPPRTMTRMPTNPSIYDERKREQIYKIRVEPVVNARYKMDRFTAEAQVTSGEDTNMKLDLKYNLVVQVWVSL